MGVFRSDCWKGSVESSECRSQWMSLAETDEEWEWRGYSGDGDDEDDEEKKRGMRGIG